MPFSTEASMRTQPKSSRSSHSKLKDESVDRDELLRRKREWSKGVAKFTRNRNKEVW